MKGSCTLLESLFWWNYLQSLKRQLKSLKRQLYSPFERFQPFERFDREAAVHSSNLVLFWWNYLQSQPSQKSAVASLNLCRDESSQKSVLKCTNSELILGNFAVHMGFPRHIAERLVMNTLLGTCLYAIQSGEHVSKLRYDCKSVGLFCKRAL